MTFLICRCRTTFPVSRRWRICPPTVRCRTRPWRGTLPPRRSTWRGRPCPSATPPRLRTSRPWRRSPTSPTGTRPPRPTGTSSPTATLPPRRIRAPHTGTPPRPLTWHMGWRRGCIATPRPPRGTRGPARCSTCSRWSVIQEAGSGHQISEVIN